MLGLFGLKVGMTEIYKGDKLIPVSVVLAGPCKVLQIKNKDKDGYYSLKLGFIQTDSKKLNKPLRGVFEKTGLKEYYKIIGEIRVNEELAKKYKVGDVIDIDIFKAGDLIKVTGRTKGRGFSGMIKRWNASRGPMSHGSKHHRKAGSNATSRIGPTRPGKRRPGKYGDETVTVRNLEIVDIIKDKNLLLIKGGVPGANNSLLKIIKLSN
ncbi:MAG: 50S ribosomal protein L3 [bacterium]|nr:50S ribosomal protein L3 [bacterium]